MYPSSDIDMSSTDTDTSASWILDQGQNAARTPWKERCQIAETADDCRSTIAGRCRRSGAGGIVGAMTADPAKGLAIGLLGQFRVSVDDRPVELPAGRLRALLAVLALSAGQPVTADRLATAVWDGEPPGNPRGNVQTNVRRLRRVLADDLIVTRREGYLLDVETDRVDALRFVRLCVDLLFTSWLRPPPDQD
jgi:hypothetical protein